MVDETKRYADELIPSDYASWRYCIEVKCGLTLNAEFLQRRIDVLSEPGHKETQRFARLYGVTHLNRVLGWYRQAIAET